MQRFVADSLRESGGLFVADSRSESGDWRPTDSLRESATNRCEPRNPTPPVFEALMAVTEAPSVEPLETFPNPRPGRDYTIEIVCPEFTSVCPKTGQPDFGTITFIYTPAAQCVELKSLKLYLQGYRNQGIFYEAAVNRLLDDFVAACRPQRCKVVGAFTPRGGLTTTVTCVYEAGVG